jgi:hypothetical protein
MIPHFRFPSQSRRYANGQSHRSLNGHAGALSGTKPAGPFNGSVPGTENGLRHYAMHDNDRETTRYLSAATQINVDYARSVVRRVIHEPYRAVAPSHGADVNVVTRWAIDSIQRLMRRDAQLAGTLCSGIALFCAFYSLLPKPIWIPVTLLVTLLTAFIIVAREHWVRWNVILAGQMLRTNFDPMAAPTKIGLQANQRLQLVADRRNGNVVIFRDKAAFSGSGERLGCEQIVIDVSHGKKDGDGKVHDPLPFTNSDIHKALAKAIARINLKDMRVEQRMFVNGRHVHGNQELQRHRLEPPYSSVPDELLCRAADQTEPDARAYVCGEVHGWQGQLMVTMFARAVHTGGWLYIEWSFYELPPISEQYMAIDYLYQDSTFRKLRETSAWSLRYTAPALLWSPFATTAAMARSLGWKAHEAGQAYRIKRGQLFDYGAMPSIREEACDKRGWRHYFLDRDEVLYILLLQKSLIREIGNFLDRHNIEQSEFKAQADIIINASYKNYSMHVGGSVSNSNISMGNKARAGGDAKPDGGRQQGGR